MRNTSVSIWLFSVFILMPAIAFTQTVTVEGLTGNLAQYNGAYFKYSSNALDWYMKEGFSWGTSEAYQWPTIGYYQYGNYGSPGWKFGQLASFCNFGGQPFVLTNDNGGPGEPPPSWDWKLVSSGDVIVFQMEGYVTHPPVTNYPPIAAAGSDQIFDCAPLAGLDVILDGSGSSDPDADPLDFSWQVGSTLLGSGEILTISLAAGVHTVTLIVDDGQGATATDDVVITINVDTQAPVITCPDNLVVNNDPGACGAVVEFQVDGVDDCDDNVSVICTPASGSVFPTGTTTVVCTAFDMNGNQSSGSFDVTVTDVEAPVLTQNPAIPVLWPVNHKYVTLSITQFVSCISDNCDDISIEDVVITRAGSDEMEDSKGSGDGNTKDDIVISGDGKSVQLRAEREGNGNGRVYTICYSVTDAAGNTCQGECYVGVPQNKNGIAVNDGVVYWVNESLGKRLANAEPVVPEGYILKQNYPNPFNPTTHIDYSIAKACHVNLEIFNMAGQRVRQLVSEYQAPGFYTVTWNARDASGLQVPSGMYIYVLQAGSVVFHEKMILTK